MSDSASSSWNRRFGLYAWCVLAYNLVVILWGAVVRATGSGAGCGEHWPLCQGVVIPHAAQIATLIEFAHRASSGVAVILVVLLLVFAFRQFASGHAVRRYAAAALIFTLTEGLIGAALVLFGQVGNNASLTRAGVLSLHLINTLLLLASIALAARAAGAPRAAAQSLQEPEPTAAEAGNGAGWDLLPTTPAFGHPSSLRRGTAPRMSTSGESQVEESRLEESRLTSPLLGEEGWPKAGVVGDCKLHRYPKADRVDVRVYLWYGAGLLAALATALTGTIAALSDTLFPAASLAQGFQLDFSASANPLLRLRIVHPLIAVAAGGYLILLGVRAIGSSVSSGAKRLAYALVALVAIQLLLGVLNLALLAPLAMQLLHLLTADLMWITLVLLSAEALGAWQTTRSSLKPASVTAPEAVSAKIA